MSYQKHHLKRKSRANKALQQPGPERFSFMSHWLYNGISFAARALPAPVAEFGG